MSQHLQVLQCYACQAYQTQIVKKINKWECKICGEKQSIKKVFGQGSGKDCRVHAQRLNELRKKNADSTDIISSQEFDTNHSIYQPQKGMQETNPAKTESKWAKYLSESSNNNSESEDSGDERLPQWQGLPQASPVAFELPHIKKQKIDYGSQDSSADFNAFSQKMDTTNKNNPLNFDLNFDDSLMQLTGDGESENDVGNGKGLNSPYEADVMANVVLSQDSLSSLKNLSQFSRDFSGEENENIVSSPISNTNQASLKFKKQSMGSISASQTKSWSNSPDCFKNISDVSPSESVVNEALGEKSDSAPKTDAWENRGTLNSFRMPDNLSDERKITSIAELKRAISRFENIDDFTEDEFDKMFRL